MSLLGDIERLINEHGSATILKERLALLRDHIERLEKRVTELDAENTQLKQLVSELRGKLQKAVVPTEFTEHRGVLFRKGPSGKYEDTVYCPRCKSPMFSLMDATPFKCSCGFIAGFNGQRLHSILVELQ